MAIRYMIQKEVYSPEDRVLLIVSVTKPGRKKRPSFLVVSGKRPPSPNSPSPSVC